jgi:protein PsiE
MRHRMNTASHSVITFIQDIGLLVIALATIIAMGMEISAIIGEKSVHLADLLLLFIYLEVLSMVSIYLDSGKLPVRMPLYIAIVALARYMILDMKNMDTMRMIGVAGATFIIACTVMLIRYGHIKFPYPKSGNDED